MRTLPVRFCTAVFLLLPLLAGCNLDSFAPIGELHPPLGLTAVSSNRTVFLSFWALNDEDFFSGFNIFMAASEAGVHLGAAPLPGASGDLPTSRQQTFTKARQFVLSVSNDPANNPLVTGNTWFFGVSAYDARNNTNSIIAERVSVTVLD